MSYYVQNISTINILHVFAGDLRFAMMSLLNMLVPFSLRVPRQDSINGAWFEHFDVAHWGVSAAPQE